MSEKKIKKRDIVGNLVEVPKRAPSSFWAKEMTILKRMEAEFPLEFLAAYKPERKVPSLAVFSAPWMKRALEIKKSEFYYQPAEQAPTPTIGTEKVGDDYIPTNKKRSLRELLS